MATAEPLTPPSPSFYERFNSPRAQQVLRLHFAEQVVAGIHKTYADALLRHLLFYCYSDETETRKRLAHVVNAEFPLLVTADHDYNSGSIVDMSLQMVDPATGKALWDSFASVIGSVDDDGAIQEFYEPWTREQAELIQRQGADLALVDLDPRDLYSDLMTGWVES